MVDLDRPCLHEHFDAEVAVNRIGENDPGIDDGLPRAYSADITVSCVDCGEHFRWIGPEAGLSPAHPTVDVTETTLHAPMRPASSDPDFGLGIPGFAIRQ